MRHLGASAGQRRGRAGRGVELRVGPPGRGRGGGRVWVCSGLTGVAGVACRECGLRIGVDGVELSEGEVRTRSGGLRIGVGGVELSEGEVRIRSGGLPTGDGGVQLCEAKVQPRSGGLPTGAGGVQLSVDGLRIARVGVPVL